MNNNQSAASVRYKGKTYTVTNPGEIIYSLTKTVSGCRHDMRPEIVDQLDNNKELVYTQTRKSRRKYLEDKYGITELDYYIIVVCLGDESKLPRCSYQNPYTGEICNEIKKFRSLTPKKSQRTGNRLGIFHDGCENHCNRAAAQISQKDNYKKGVTGLQKADRTSKEWRKKLSDSAKRQILSGKSIFSPDDIRDKNIKSVKEFNTNPSIDFYKLTAKRLGLDIDNLSIDNCILIDKENFLRKGSLNDNCFYYITTFKETSEYFKLGVSVDINKRSNKPYHGYTYDKCEVIFSSTRETIAEIEYQVKLKFKDLISLGNEAFRMTDKEIIMSFIDELLISYKNN